MDVGEMLRSWVTVAVVGVLAAAVIAPLVWLAGLVISLWGTKPDQRSEVLKAYGDAQPPKALRHRRRRR